MDPDADDRARIRAVARLAKWYYRAGRWGCRDDCPLPDARFARWRRDAAERHVQRVAVRDLLAGHDDPDANVAALDLDPGDDAGHHAAAVYWRALADLAGYLDALRGPAPDAGVPPEPETGQVRGHDRRW